MQRKLRAPLPLVGGQKRVITGGSGEPELAHADQLTPEALRAAGDVALSFEFSLPVPAVPVKPCGCQVCLKAASRAPRAARGRLSACESIRRKRERNLLGIGVNRMSPGSGYRVDDLARFLRISVGSVIHAAKRVGVLRKPEGDHRYAPLTRREAKRVIQACRAK